MTDYGHDLLFGTFITPVAQPAMQAVDLAIVADRAGLDLATFQDHPYQPTFHDTWTLLAYVASRTKQIHVSGNVLNLPLRQPVEYGAPDLLHVGKRELATSTKCPSFGVLDLAVGPWYTRGSMNA